MQISSYKSSQKAEVVKLFENVFSESESPEEGKLIAKLVSDMTESTNKKDIFGFIARNNDILLGGIFFTRLRFKDSVEAFILSPVAVNTSKQGKGIGQKLVKHGIDQLKKANVQLLFTYGDPAFYSKVGFQPISEDLIKAPLDLSQPEGWLCQSLTEEGIPAVFEKPICVGALNKPIYW